MDRQFKRTRKGAVQLTSLLDLLFVMIFVSLLQQKEVTPLPPVKTKVKVVKQTPKVKIVHSVTAVFDFYSVQGQELKGKYLMEGIYNKKTGNINLGSVKWIDKPPFDIGMVPLSGVVSKDQSSFTGRVEFTGCKKFNLKRVSIINGSPIAGNWKGTYTCAQGQTGLTLSIK
jgi:hypothetical protein